MASVRRLVDREAPRVLPLGVAHLPILAEADRLHQHVARRQPFSFFTWMQHLLAGLAAQQLAFVRHAERVHAVDGGDDLAFLHQRFGPGERRSLVGQVGIVRIDVLHHEAAGLFIPPQPRSEGCQVNVVLRLARIAAPNKRVQRGKLAHHLRNHVVELVAVGHAIHQRQIAVAHRRPIHAVHVAVVESNRAPAATHPGTCPWYSSRRIGGDRPVRQIDFRLALRLGIGGCFTSESKM